MTCLFPFGPVLSSHSLSFFFSEYCQAAPLWVALHDLLLAEELRRRRCRRRLGQPLRSDTVSRTTTADLESTLKAR